MKKTMVIKLLGTLAIVAALAAMCIAPVSATTTPPGILALTATGFMMKANMHLTDLTGAASTTNYQYVDLKIATDVDGAVGGTLDLYPTNDFKGVVISHPKVSGGATWTKPAISASFTMHITKLGTFIVTCPKGVAGTATSGTTTVTGSVKTLAEGTSTTVTTTGVTGNITIAFHLVKRTMTINATGFVGSGYAPRISLVLADTSGYFAGTLNGRLYLNSNNTVKSLTGRIDGMIDINGATSGGQTIFDTTGYGLARSTE